MLIILIGKSGCGKDTIKKELCDNMGFIPIISTTTREIRPTETDGIDYNFTSIDDFENKVKEKIIFEYREYESSNGKVYYGSERIQLNNNEDYLKILDVEGAKTYIDTYGRERCFITEVYVHDALRFKRAFERKFGNKSLQEEWRNNDSKEKFMQEWSLRLVDDNERFSYNKTCDIVNFTLINQSDLESAVNEFSKALSAYKNRMNEFIENAHLHSNMKYPQLLVKQSTNGYYAGTIEELNRQISLEQHLAIENLESLEINER